MKPVNDVIGGLGTTIFTVMSALSVEHGAINLGQGFPDEDGPADVREAAARAAMDGPNQYPPMMGLPALRQAVAAHNQRFYGLDVDWRTQVLVTSGATEALTASLLALLRPGDEAVLIEPVYDSYLPIVQLAGAAARMVRLRPPGSAAGETGNTLDYRFDKLKATGFAVHGGMDAEIDATLRLCEKTFGAVP